MNYAQKSQISANCAGGVALMLGEGLLKCCEELVAGADIFGDVI